PVTFDGGFTDAGTLDTHTATFDYGDGTALDTTKYGASGQGDTVDTSSFAAPGTYTVRYTVTDDDNGSSFVTVTVTVQTPAAGLGDLGSPPRAGLHQGQSGLAEPEPVNPGAPLPQAGEGQGEGR